MRWMLQKEKYVKMAIQDNPERKLTGAALGSPAERAARLEGGKYYPPT